MLYLAGNTADRYSQFTPQIVSLINLKTTRRIMCSGIPFGYQISFPVQKYKGCHRGDYLSVVQ